MTEIPEHLLAKAKAAREKAAAKKADGADAPAAAEAKPVEDDTPVVEPDEKAEAALAILKDSLGDVVIESHIEPHRGLWIRVAVQNWRAAAIAARDDLDCKFFDFLSVIDWMPSPYGREFESEQDVAVHGRDDKTPEPMTQGYAGGSTRFQVFCRVHSVTRHLGVIIKADLDDADPRFASLIPVYAGANWHEREAAEMFGVGVDEHPDVRNIYLPTDFEGHPLRKDYPLLARRVKPWPGIVDVEPMPGNDDSGAAAEETS